MGRFDDIFLRTGEKENFARWESRTEDNSITSIVLRPFYKVVTSSIISLAIFVSLVPSPLTN